MFNFLHSRLARISICAEIECAESRSRNLESLFIYVYSPLLPTFGKILRSRMQRGKHNNSCARSASGCATACGLLDLGPGVFEREGAVEDQLVRRRVGIDAEVADALELEAVLELGVGERGLQLGAGENLQRVGVEIARGRSRPSSKSPGSALVKSLS